MSARKYSIFALSILIGLLMVSQYYSFKNVEDLVVRDSSFDVFSQLHTLKRTSESLQNQIIELEEQIAQFSNKAEAREQVQNEVRRLEILLGRVSVSGGGITVNVSGDIAAIWLTDMINVLWNAGAEAISINDIRLTPKTSGLSQVGESQILLSGNLLAKPYAIAAIGERKVLEKSLTQPSGVLNSLKSAYPEVEVEIRTEEKVMMGKI